MRPIRALLVLTAAFTLGVAFVGAALPALADPGPVDAAIAAVSPTLDASAAVTIPPSQIGASPGVPALSTWGAIWHFIVANQVVILLILGVGLASLITRLTPYPKARGAISVLQVLLDVVSFLQHRDSPGTYQVPLLQRSVAPGAAVASPRLVDTMKFVPLLWLPLAALSLAGCTPTQSKAWKQLGLDAAACSAPAAGATIQQGAADVTTALTGGAITADAVKAQGIALATKYGTDLAWCILQKAWADLGPVVFGGAPEGDPRPRVKWLLDHPEQWVPKGQALHRLRLLAEFLAPSHA